MSVRQTPPPETLIRCLRTRPLRDGRLGGPGMPRPRVRSTWRCSLLGGMCVAAATGCLAFDTTSGQTPPLTTGGSATERLPPNDVEVRAGSADGFYRYVGYSYVFGTGVVAEALYVGPTGAWEFGPSVSAFYTEGELSWAAGGVVVRNDGLGAWRAYARTGSEIEVRLVRTFDF